MGTVTHKQIDAAISILTAALENTTKEKTDRAFVSDHESFGALSEEYYEALEALRRNDSADYAAELIDVAVVCVFAVAGLLELD